MNTPLFVKSLRNVIADDSTMRTLIGETTSANMLNKRLFYKDATFSEIEGNFAYPAILIKTDDDDPTERGIDTNTLMIELTIINKFGADGAQMLNMQIKDRLKILLHEKHELLNNRAKLFSATLHCRDLAWVSAITYDDKTQGTQRLHRNICTMKAIVGD